MCPALIRHFGNGAYAVVDNICLAQFAAYYYKDYKQTEEMNDSQPVVLQPESFEVQQIDSVNLPTKVRLMTRNETMKRRKVKAVIRYHKPNRTTEPEDKILLPAAQCLSASFLKILSKSCFSFLSYK